MIGIVPDRDSKVDVSFLRLFRNLASCGKVRDGAPPGHSDGWGVVSWRFEFPYYLGREPRNAHSDPAYEEMLKHFERYPIASLVIGHLRKASLGEKTIENTHPFVQGSWAFAHNGTIRKLNLKDRTDSEWFFLSLMNELRMNGSNMLNAISRKVETAHALYNYSSITFLLSDGKELYAYRDYSNYGDYYTLYFTRARNCFVVCQEKIVDADWIELENRQLLHVKNGAYSVTDLPQVQR